LSEAPARLRGTAAGLLTAALTLAAHSAGGGGVPTGVTALQLLVVAAVLGGVATSVPRTHDAATMAALLAVGQLVGHGVLAAHGDHHGAGISPPGWAMMAAHVGATVVGALLISFGNRLCHILSRALRGAVRRTTMPVAETRNVVGPSPDQPVRANLVLQSSISHRGPPVGVSR